MKKVIAIALLDILIWNIVIWAVYNIVKIL